MKRQELAASIYEEAAQEFSVSPGPEAKRQAASAWLGAANHRRILGQAEAALNLYQTSADAWRQLGEPLL